MVGQRFQRARNGETPQVFEGAVDFVIAPNAEESSYELSFTDRVADEETMRLT